MNERQDRNRMADWTELAARWLGNDEPFRNRAERRRALADRVRRRAARRRWTFAAEIAMGIAMVAIAGLYARSRPDAVGWSVFVYTALAVAAAGLFSWWNRKQTPRRDLAAPARALAAARRDLEMRSRAVRFGWLLLAAHAVFFGVWLPFSGTDLTTESIAFLVLWFAVFIGSLALFDRRIRREAEELERLREDLDTEPPGD